MDMSKLKMDFYCGIVTGELFDINEWNKAFKYCVDNNLNEKETSQILEGGAVQKAVL